MASTFRKNGIVVDLKWLIVFLGVSPLLCHLLLVSYSVPNGGKLHFAVESEERNLFEITLKSFETGFEVVEDGGDFLILKKK